MVHAGVLVVMVVCAWTYGRSDVRVSHELHTSYELGAALIAAMIGALAIARFLSRRDNVFLFIGTGFLGTAVFDGYHLFVTSDGLASVFGDRSAELVPWTWLASRVFLSSMMVLGWYFAWREERDVDHHPSPVRVWIVAGVVALVTFVLFTIAPLPHCIFSDSLIPRPVELLPGALFALALLLEYRSGKWRADAFHHHIVLSVMTGAVCQFASMAFSRELYDSAFGAAHILKVTGYLFILLGLLQEVARSFRVADQAQTLHDFNEQLSSRVIDMTHELVRRNNELHLLIEELREARDQAEAANEAKSRFLATMSHELRTPLTAILGYCELLHEDAVDEGADERGRDLMRIWDAGDHLLHVINDVLDLARIESGRINLVFDDVPVEPLVRAATLTLQAAIERGGNELIVELEPDLPVLRTDHIRLRQCLLNVLSNAAKFCENGTIRVSVTHDSTREHVVFDITDSGIGMSPEQVSRVFDAFEQADGSTSRRYGGSGLGLAITRRLLTLLGGAITVTSAPSEGSTFSLSVPIRAPDPGSDE